LTRLRPYQRREGGEKKGGENVQVRIMFHSNILYGSPFLESLRRSNADLERGGEKRGRGEGGREKSAVARSKRSPMPSSASQEMRHNDRGPQLSHFQPCDKECQAGEDLDGVGLEKGKKRKKKGEKKGRCLLQLRV